MKKVFISFVFLLLVLVSCNTNKHIVTAMDNIIVYDNYDGYGEMCLWGPPNILILKTDREHPENNSYENYFNAWGSVLGKWKVLGDTLYLYPVYEFRYDTLVEISKINLDSLKSYDEYVVNQKWLIKDDCIYDRSDYSFYSKYDEKWELGKDFYKYMYNPNRSLRLRSKAKLK